MSYAKFQLSKEQQKSKTVAMEEVDWDENTTDVNNMFEDISCSICDEVTIEITSPDTKLAVYFIGPERLHAPPFMKCTLADYERFTGYDSVYLIQEHRGVFHDNRLPGLLISCFAVLEEGTVDGEAAVEELNALYNSKLNGYTLMDHLEAYQKLMTDIDCRIRNVCVA